MKKTDFLIFLIFSFLLICPILFNISSTFPRLDTDYDSNLPIYHYMVNFFWKYHYLPLTIPFVAKGIPVFGDPLNSFLNPFLSVPLLLFGINAGLRISIFINVFLSGLAMYWLLHSVRLRRVIMVGGSLLYMSSGAFIAQVAAGHVEKFLVYPFVPIFLLFALKPIFSLRDSIFSGMIIAATVYSGDFYATWFLLLFFGVIRLYYFFVEKKTYSQILYPLSVLPFSFALGFAKLYPFLTTVLPSMQRYFLINPYQGSVHALLMPLFFIIPFQVSFYDRPFFQHHLGFSFNWYEYYAFLSPLPFIFLLKIKKVWSAKLTKALLLIVAVGAMYISLGFIYSPFFWFFHVFHNELPFRVPQRIVLPLTTVVILLLSLCTDVWLKEKKGKWKFVFAIFSLSLIWITSIFWQTLLLTFPKRLSEQPMVINKFSKMYVKNESVVSFVPQTQFFLSEKGIPISNYYYGWVPKGTETYIQNKKYDFVKLLNEKPVYVLVSPYVSLVSYGYTNLIENGTIAVWKRD